MTGGRSCPLGRISQEEVIKCYDSNSWQISSPYTMLCITLAEPCASYLVFSPRHACTTLTILTLQMKKLRHSEIWHCKQGHKANMWIKLKLYSLVLLTVPKNCSLRNHSYCDLGISPVASLYPWLFNVGHSLPALKC